MKYYGKKIILGGILLVVLIFIGGVLVVPRNARAEENKCVIKEARFWPSGDKGSGWYTDSYRPQVRVDIWSENCIGKKIQISIRDSDDHNTLDDVFTRDSIDNMNGRPIEVPGDYFSIKLVAGEDECEMSDNPDCNYYFKIDKTSDGATEEFLSQNKEGGMLRYQCDGSILFGACDEIWGFLGIKKFTDWTTLTDDLLGTPLSGYVLLEPLGEFTSLDAEKEGLGGYLNKIFAVVIGLAGLLAVLMLVINGIQYMMTDSVFQKGEAKSGIGNALLGLFLALGAFVILNTINPDLVNLDLNPDKISIDINDMPMIVGAPGTALGDYIVGEPWTPSGITPSETDARKKLSDAGITVTSSTGATCTTVGQPGCTSAGGLPYSTIDKIIALKTKCNCPITVTGATEYWLHKTHGLGKAVVDFSVTPGLTKYIMGTETETFPADCEDYAVNKDGLNFIAKAEATPACVKWSPAPHWHIVFN